MIDAGIYQKIREEEKECWILENFKEFDKVFRYPPIPQIDLKKMIPIQILKLKQFFDYLEIPHHSTGNCFEYDVSKYIELRRVLKKLF